MQKFSVRGLMLGAIILAVTLAGCINYDQQVDVNKNGSGKMIMHYSMAQQLVSMMSMGDQGGGGSDQEMPFKLKEEEVKKDLAAQGVKVDKFETKTEGDQQHFYVHISFDNIANLNQTQTFKDMQFGWTDADGVITYTQTLKGKPKKEGEADDPQAKQMAQAMFGSAAFKYTVKLPSKALPAPDTNGTIAEDGMTVSWSYPLVELDSGDKVMTAKFKSGGLPFSIGMIAIVAGAVLLSLIGLAFIIMVMRKK
jgi:hypothetical protein